MGILRKLSEVAELLLTASKKLDALIDKMAEVETRLSRLEGKVDAHIVGESGRII